MSPPRCRRVEGSSTSHVSLRSLVLGTSRVFDFVLSFCSDSVNETVLES